MRSRVSSTINRASSLHRWILRNGSYVVLAVRLVMVWMFGLFKPRTPRIARRHQAQSAALFLWAAVARECLAYVFLIPHVDCLEDVTYASATTSILS